MEVMNSTTITISDKTRRELLKVAGELQLRLGRKVDYEDAIEYLLHGSRRDERLLLQAVLPTGRQSTDIHEALRSGRAEDKRREEAHERRYT